MILCALPDWDRRRAQAAERRARRLHTEDSL